MAERNRQKAKQPAGAPTTSSGAAPVARSADKTGDHLAGAVDRLEARARQLERERDDLKLKLAAANARVAILEAANRDAVNRIDWVLDSLHTVLDQND